MQFSVAIHYFTRLKEAKQAKRNGNCKNDNCQHLWYTFRGLVIKHCDKLFTLILSCILHNILKG